MSGKFGTTTLFFYGPNLIKPIGKTRFFLENAENQDF
jgi:hypothetical protein